MPACQPRPRRPKGEITGPSHGPDHSDAARRGSSGSRGTGEVGMRAGPRAEQQRSAVGPGRFGGRGSSRPVRRAPRHGQPLARARASGLASWLASIRAAWVTRSPRHAADRTRPPHDCPLDRRFRRVLGHRRRPSERGRPARGFAGPGRRPGSSAAASLRAAASAAGPARETVTETGAGERPAGRRLPCSASVTIELRVPHAEGREAARWRPPAEGDGSTRASGGPLPSRG